MGPDTGFVFFFASLPGGERRFCFDVCINDDLLYEDTESFTVILDLIPIDEQSGILVDPNIAEIKILDDDGNQGCISGGMPLVIGKEHNMELVQFPF